MLDSTIPLTFPCKLFSQGALYCLLGNHSGVCLANLHDWDCIVQTWPALVSSGLSQAMSLEKPSIVRLFDDLAEKIHRQYETIGLDFTVSKPFICSCIFYWKFWLVFYFPCLSLFSVLIFWHVYKFLKSINFLFSFNAFQ